MLLKSKFLADKRLYWKGILTGALSFSLQPVFGLAVQEAAVVPGAGREAFRVSEGRHSGCRKGGIPDVGKEAFRMSERRRSGCRKGGIPDVGKEVFRLRYLNQCFEKKNQCSVERNSM